MLFVLCLSEHSCFSPSEETTRLALATATTAASGGSAGGGGLTVRQGETFSVEVECVRDNGATNTTGVCTLGVVRVRVLGTGGVSNGFCCRLWACVEGLCVDRVCPEHLPWAGPLFQ